MSATGTATAYRFAPALLLRAYGALLALVGVVVAAVAVLVGAAGLPVLALTVALVGALVVTVAIAVTLARRTEVVRFDEHGYRVRLLRRAGVRQARWREVEDAVAATLAGQRCVVLRLRDGRTTTVPVTVLDTSVEELLRDLRSRLDRGRGYRRIR